jgi:hypothetical protein
MCWHWGKERKKERKKLEFYGYYFAKSNKRALTFTAFISFQLFACNVVAQHDNIKDSVAVG